MDQDVRLTQQARLNEFRFNQLLDATQTLTFDPIVLNAVVVLIDNLCDRVWLNGTYQWTANFDTDGGIATVLFEIFRNDTLIYSTQQSISGPDNDIGINIAQLQHVDLNPVMTPGITPVLYQVRATLQSVPVNSFIQVNNRVFSAAEIKTKTPVSP